MWTPLASSGPLPWLLPTTTAGSHPHWLGPRRHAEEQHLAQRPDVIRQSSGPGRRTRQPRLGGARPVGRQGLWQRHAEAGMGQAEIIIDMVQGQLLAYAVLVFGRVPVACG